MIFNIGAVTEYLKTIGLNVEEYHTTLEYGAIPQVVFRCSPFFYPYKQCEKPIKKRNASPYLPLRIVKNGVATIVFWQDGTKTVVKRGSDEPESDYAAFTAALGIKIFGSNSALKRIVSRTETQLPKKKGKPE